MSNFLCPIKFEKLMLFFYRRDFDNQNEKKKYIKKDL